MAAAVFRGLGGGGAGWGDDPGPAFGRRLFSCSVDHQYDMPVPWLHIRTDNSLFKIHRSLRRDIRVSGSYRVIIDELSARLSLVQERAYGNHRKG